MTKEELTSITVSRYMDLLRIQKAEDRDKEIENQKRELRVVLETMGVAVENLRID